MRKKVIAVAATAAVALSIGAASVASAHGGLGGKGAGLTTLLSDLVAKGTITQSQADATALPERVSATAAVAIAATTFFFIDPHFFKYSLHLM